MMKNIICWIRYRKERKAQARRAASLAVQLVLNGCLMPPRLAGRSEIGRASCRERV